VFFLFCLMGGVAALVEAAEGQEIRKGGEEGWLEEGWGEGGVLPT